MSLTIDIRKSFPTFKLDVSFEAGNEVIGLLGASGCGKSLTMRCIAGLEKPDEGRIVAAGVTFFDSEKGINLTAQQRKTALLFQNYMLFPNLTVAQNIAAGMGRNVSKAQVHDLVEAQLIRFGLKGFGKRYPIRLSGGQQQRVALARMLAAEPKILMLDEPFSALDSHLKSQLEQDLLDLFDEFAGTIIYVSHDIDEAFRFCNRIAVIDKGELQEVSTTSEILNHPSTLATLQVSGVKNISAARKLGPRQVEALDWGVTLTTADAVPDDVAYLGVRAQFIELASEQRENCLDCRVARTIDSRFERMFVLVPSDSAKRHLQMRRSMEHGMDTPGNHQAPQRTDGHARIFIPPSRIYLVNR